VLRQFRRYPPGSPPAGCTSEGGCAAPEQAWPGSTLDRIDPAAVGPYLLTPAERAALSQAAWDTVACLRTGYDVTAHIVVSPTGRPEVISPYPGDVCYNSTLRRKNALTSA
jgi:hypothetical protein